MDNGKHHVEITIEKALRIAVSLELSESDYNMLLCRDITPALENEKINYLLNSATEDDYIYDFAVFDEDKNIQVVEWD